MVIHGDWKIPSSAHSGTGGWEGDRSHSCAEGGFLAWPFELAVSDDLPEFELLLELEHVIFSLKAIIFWSLRGCCSSYTGFIGWFIVSPDFDFKRKWPDKYWKGKKNQQKQTLLYVYLKLLFSVVSEAPFCHWSRLSFSGLEMPLDTIQLDDVWARRSWKTTASALLSPHFCWVGFEPSVDICF